MKVSVVIPVYNEAATVRTLLDRVWKQPLAGLTKELVIVESNSTDGSREFVQAFCAEHAHDAAISIRTVYQPKPRGKGHAIREGLLLATGDIALIQDADLEYDVADYPALLQPIVDGSTAFVLGSRHLGAASWQIRKFGRIGLRAIFINCGGVLFHGLFNALFASKLTDPTTMYKVFRLDCIKGLTFTCNLFDFDFELLGKLIRAGFYPLEVPVSYKSRGFDEGKKIRLVRDAVAGIVAIFKCRFAKLRTA
jgi:glycosyltransferase involved in cell wall biosynthesis